jgi:hypothetical protein
MVEMLSSYETSILTRATWHNIQEDGILPKGLWMEEYIEGKI